ncbi:hypothetical protein SUGI_1159530 [Cryptomeria japonica]|nr:hypothetical protein SUGI_1159530 [Cryptomeria japonica]
MVREENAVDVPKEWKKMKVQELRDELSRKGLSTAGLRPALLERLDKSSSPSENGATKPPKPQLAESTPPSEDVQVNCNDASGKEEQERECTANAKEEDSCGSITSPDKSEPAKFVEPAAVEKSSNDRKDNGGVTTSTAEALTDLQKKHRRAERFGLALQLTEEEKRRSRAARFSESQNGSLKPNSPSLGDTKLSEEERRKARAERFGLSPRSAADDEAKKKARLARFGLDAKSDSSEDNKRKARAARFAPASCGNNINGFGGLTNVDSLGTLLK